MALHDAPGGVNSGDNVSWAFDLTSTSTSTSSTSTSSTSISTSSTSSSTSISSTSTSVSSTSTSVSSTSTSSTSTSVSSTSTSVSSTSTSISTSSTSVSNSTSSTSQSTSLSTSTSTSVSSTSTSTTLPIGGGIVLKIGNDIVFEASAARDYEEEIYAYGPVYISISDSTADATIYVSVPYKGANANSPYPPKNWQFRIHSEQHNTAVQSGYMVDPLHFSGGARNQFVCPEGAVITRVSINIAP